jgi:hypothetical protein
MERVGVLIDLRLHGSRNIVQHLANIECFKMQVHSAGFDLGQIEHIVDQQQQMPAATLIFCKSGMKASFPRSVASSVSISL